MEKYGRARHTTDDNIIWRMRSVFWITKATSIYSEYLIIIAFHVNIRYAKTPQSYVIRTLPILSLGFNPSINAPTSIKFY